MSGETYLARLLQDMRPVKFHVSSIYQKLNVTNRTEAVRAGLRGGWIVL